MRPQSLLLPLLLAACSGSSGGGSSSPEPDYWRWGRQGPVGAEALTALDALPRLRRGVQAMEFSSYDRSGQNDSGFSGNEEFLYQEPDGATVLVDITGPGAIYDLYTGWLNIGVEPEIEQVFIDQLGNLQVFLDGASQPVVDLSPAALYDRQHLPFTGSLVYDDQISGYGNVSYVPIPFAESCRIRLTAGPRPMWFYQIWAQRFESAEGVATYTGNEALDAARAMLDAVGEDPKDPAVRANNRKVEGSVQLGRANILGESALIFEQEKGGRIQSIRLAPDDGGQTTASLMRTVWIRMEWDGEVRVDAPLALFFATGHRDTPPGAYPSQAAVHSIPSRSVFAGEDGEGGYYNFLPMPFARSARIWLHYPDHPPVIPATFNYAIEAHELREGETPGVNDGYLQAQYRKITFDDYVAPGGLGEDALLLEAEGQGHYVGLVMMADDTPESFMEGDERVYIDGSLTPQVIGTATETFFQGGWYFGERPFSLPLHGAPVLVLQEGLAFGRVDATLYRWHPTDMIPFNRSIRFGIQHGPINNVPVNYESLAFFYGVDRPALEPADEIDIGDTESELAHGFEAEGGLPDVVSLSAYYEGDNDGSVVGENSGPMMLALTPGEATEINTNTVINPPPTPAPEDSPQSVSDDGRELKSRHRFTLRINPDNDGLIIRRRYDQLEPLQRAHVRIDGEDAGLWSCPGRNPHKRWRDDDFEIAPELVSGKSEITVEIEPLYSDWPTYHYWAFTYTGTDSE